MANQIDSNLPRDTFLYLLAIIALVAVAVSFGVLIFQFVNIYFPDLATDFYQCQTRSVACINTYGDAIRQAMAVLIIVFPIFLWVSNLLRKDIIRNPGKRELKIRKWLLYLTLFTAALVIIGDLVAVLNSFLRGELTIRFVLKALAILFIAGSAFYYYLSQLRAKGLKWFGFCSWLMIAIVAVSVVEGFMLIGSPSQQRAMRFDEQRVSDLQNIQSQIVYYWQSKQKLPATLDELKNSISGFTVPLDPETRTAYEYNIDAKAKLPSFQLCATFKTSDSGTLTPYPAAVPPKPGLPASADSTFNTWQHEAGRYCFSRIIDPDLYPQLKK